MAEDGLGDWRIVTATRLERYLPGTPQGAPAHKAGAPVYLSTLTRSSSGELIGFVAPSVASLALNLASRAAERAEVLRLGLSYKDTVSPHGAGRSIADNDIPNLFELFESCMTCITFSFQALEVFCNHSIASRSQKPFPIETNDDVVHLDPNQLQRTKSTEFKLGDVLPDLFQVPTPKGRRIWQEFKELQSARNGTLHMKAKDQYRGADIEDPTLLFRFLDADVRKYPVLSHEIITYFFGNEQKPRWLRLAKLPRDETDSA